LVRFGIAGLGRHSTSYRTARLPNPQIPKHRNMTDCVSRELRVRALERAHWYSGNLFPELTYVRPDTQGLHSKTGSQASLTERSRDVVVARPSIDALLLHSIMLVGGSWSSSWTLRSDGPVSVRDAMKVLTPDTCTDDHSYTPVNGPRLSSVFARALQLRTKLVLFFANASGICPDRGLVL